MQWASFIFFSTLLGALIFRWLFLAIKNRAPRDRSRNSALWDLPHVSSDRSPILPQGIDAVRASIVTCNGFLQRQGVIGEYDTMFITPLTNFRDQGKYITAEFFSDRYTFLAIFRASSAYWELTEYG